MSGSIALLWDSPLAESGICPQAFKATRGEAIAITFSRDVGSTRTITGATITLRFATSPTAQKTLKVSAVVSGTTFTASVTSAQTTALTARRWYFQAFDETASELLSWGWMTLLENTDLVG